MSEAKLVEISNKLHQERTKFALWAVAPENAELRRTDRNFEEKYPDWEKIVQLRNEYLEVRISMITDPTEKMIVASGIHPA